MTNTTAFTNSAHVTTPTTPSAEAVTTTTTRTHHHLNSNNRATTVPSTIYTTNTTCHNNSNNTTTTTTTYHRRTTTTTTRTVTEEDLSFTMSTPRETTTTTVVTNDLPEKETTTMKEGIPSSPTESESHSEEQEPYQELKWTHAPLFLNDNFDNPSELLQNEKQTLPIHAGRTALLVVDVQPEYWSQCPAVRQDFPEFPARLAKLVAQCRQQKAKIIWVRADYRYAHSPWLVQFARLHQGRIPSEVYSDPNQADEIQWEEFATPQGGEYVIPKTSWSSTRHTALMDLLKQSGIDTVLVCGLITSVCVQHSAFGIFEAGYRTLLVTDACADRGKARHDAALALYGDYMYELLTVQDLCEPQNPFYLKAAQPVWLTPASVEQLVQPQLFNTLQDSIVMKMPTDEEDDLLSRRTATRSNRHLGQDHPEVVKVPTNHAKVVGGNSHLPPRSDSKESSTGGADKSIMMNATDRTTSTSSLSTLSSRNLTPQVTAETPSIEQEQALVEEGAIQV